MALHNYEYRFEIKPGRFVYIQNSKSRIVANAIIRQVLARYKPNRIFYHLERRGGHVAALRLHQHSNYFSRFDIENFFGQITRSRVARCLRHIGFGPTRAFNAAIESVVVEAGRKVIPYGFRQSPVLATLALERSQLGKTLIGLGKTGILVSVYMDDILLSGGNVDAVRAASASIEVAAAISRFPLSTTKRVVAASAVDSFNCHIESLDLTILTDRMDKFVDDYHAKPDAQEAISKYIMAISESEHGRFLGLI